MKKKATILISLMSERHSLELIYDQFGYMVTLPGDGVILQMADFRESTRKVHMSAVSQSVELFSVELNKACLKAIRADKETMSLLKKSGFTLR